MDLKPYIAEVINGRDLSFEQATKAMNVIMDGNATQAQIGSYLTALRMKGETLDEIAGSAASMRAHYIPVNLQPYEGMLAEIVGTGGDGKHTFNVSTTTAFVVAGYNVKVAKHGNRAASSKSGSADLLMALGANLDLNAEQVGQCIDDVGFGFMYAIKHHPAMKHAIGPRRELGQRTIFNILGPLTNPANSTHLLIGVYDPNLTELMAGVLAKLGAKKAMVVHGAGGMDELSAIGPNKVSEIVNGEIVTRELDPQDYGIARAKLEDLIGGTPEENKQITLDILSGKEQGPKRDMVLINAAAALSLDCGDFAAGLDEARESIDSGKALAKMEEWVAKTNSF